MPTLGFFNRISKTHGLRGLTTGLAILALLAVVAIAAVNATATPTDAPQRQIQGWVDELKQSQLTVSRQQAQRNLEASGQAAVPQLLVALRSDSAAQRANAADMLGYIGSPAAVDALRNALSADPVPTVRRNAAFALGQIHDARAVNELQQAAAADGSQMVRGAAADSLARIRTVLAQSANVNEQLVGALAAAPSQPNLVYVAARRDLNVSADAGTSWQTLTDTLPSQVSALAVNPSNARELFAGVDGMGIFKSADGGATWRAINNGINLTVGARETISAIAIDPSDPQALYIARGVWLGTGTVTFYPTGLLQSRDGGASWQQLSAGSTSESIAKLAFRNGQLFGLAGNRVLTLVTPQ